MRTPEEVVKRLRDDIGEEAFEKVSPIINNNGIDFDRLRRYYLRLDYWNLLKKNEGRVQITLDKLSVEYDVCIRTVRNVVYR